MNLNFMILQRNSTIHFKFGKAFIQMRESKTNLESYTYGGIIIAFRSSFRRDGSHNLHLNSKTTT